MWLLLLDIGYTNANTIIAIIHQENHLPNQPSFHWQNSSKRKILKLNIQKSNDFGRFLLPEVRKKTVKVSRFLYLVFNV
jgi:hypothetical protein